MLHFPKFANVHRTFLDIFQYFQIYPTNASLESRQAKAKLVQTRIRTLWTWCLCGNLLKDNCFPAFRILNIVLIHSPFWGFQTPLVSVYLTPLYVCIPEENPAMNFGKPLWESKWDSYHYMSIHGETNKWLQHKNTLKSTLNLSLTVHSCSYQVHQLGCKSLWKPWLGRLSPWRWSLRTPSRMWRLRSR